MPYEIIKQSGMPYKIVKRKGPRPYKIVKKLASGRTKTVGSSRTKANAVRSMRARQGGEHDWKPTRRRKGG